MFLNVVPCLQFISHRLVQGLCGCDFFSIFSIFSILQWLPLFFYKKQETQNCRTNKLCNVNIIWSLRQTVNHKMRKGICMKWFRKNLTNTATCLYLHQEKNKKKEKCCKYLQYIIFTDFRWYLWKRRHFCKKQFCNEMKVTTFNSTANWLMTPSAISTTNTRNKNIAKTTKAIAKVQTWNKLGLWEGEGGWRRVADSLCLIRL